MGIDLKTPIINRKIHVRNDGKCPVFPRESLKELISPVRTLSYCFARGSMRSCFLLREANSKDFQLVCFALISSTWKAKAFGRLDSCQPHAGHMWFTSRKHQRQSRIDQPVWSCLASSILLNIRQKMDWISKVPLCCKKPSSRSWSPRKQTLVEKNPNHER